MKEGVDRVIGVHKASAGGNANNVRQPLGTVGNICQSGHIDAWTERQVDVHHEKDNRM